MNVPLVGYVANRGTTARERHENRTTAKHPGLHRQSMLALRHIVPANGARILLKLESANPTGSMKDRMALAMIEAAETDGRLKPGAAVVEYTGGSTGVSLAFICAVKKHPLHIVSSDAFAREKLAHMRILGAELQIITKPQRRHDRKAHQGHD